MKQKSTSHLNSRENNLPLFESHHIHTLLSKLGTSDILKNIWE